jgi:hypothetical protein
LGDQQLIIDRALVDKNGNQLGSFVLHAPADVVCHRAPPHHWLANVGLVRPAADHRAPSFWMLSPTPERSKSPLIDTLHQEQLPGKDA